MTDPRRAAVVAAAASQIGPGDTPKYWASCRVSPAPEPNTPTGHWCGALALWALHQAGLALGQRWVIGLGFAGPLRLPTTKFPEPGDVAYTHEPYQHHAIVESWDGTTLVTIDGNQPDVRRRIRPMPKGIVFYSIAPLLGQRPAAPPKPAPPKPTPPKPASPKPAPVPAPIAEPVQPPELLPLELDHDELRRDRDRLISEET